MATTKFIAKLSPLRNMLVVGDHKETHASSIVAI